MKRRHSHTLTANARARRMVHPGKSGRTKAPNPLKLDPSRTITLRKAFQRELRKRFRELRRRIWHLIAEEDALGLAVSTGTSAALMQPPKQPKLILTNQRWRFHSSPAKLQAFRDWLKAQQQQVFDSSYEAAVERYINEGFRKGAGRSFDDVRKPARAKATAAATAGQVRNAAAQDVASWYQGTREEFLRSAFGQPVAREKVELLASRVFTDLEGITESMDAALTRTLVNGLVRGANPREIARDLARDVDGLGAKRAETIARDAIIGTHAEGQLLALEQLGVEEVGVMAEWQATPDERTCSRCQAMEGLVLKIEEAHGLLPLHPNCRCSWVPNIGFEGDTPRQSKEEIEEVFEEVARGAEEDWADLRVDISADRPRSVLDRP